MKRPFSTSRRGRLCVRTLVACLVAGAALVAATAHAAAADTYDTTTTFTASPSSADVGNTVTFTATVTGSTTPTGTVFFWRVGSSVALCSAPLQATTATTATATCATNGLATGTYSVWAHYGPDDYSVLNPSDSAVASVTVGQKVTHTTSTSLSATPSTFTTGTPEAFTATVVSTDGSGIVPGGTVVFDDNGFSLGSALLDASGVATISGVTGFVEGDNVITASYEGNGIDTLVSSASVDLVVPHTTVSSIQTITTVSTDPQVIETGDSVTITAHVVQSGGQTPVLGDDVVSFSANGSPLGSAPLDANGYASITHAGWVAGTYDIEASYVGNSIYHYEGSQGGVMLGVVDPSSRTATAIVVGGDVTEQYGGTALLSAALTSGTTPLVGEDVTIELGTQSCSATTDGTGTAACSIALTQAAGTYTVTATYAGGTTYKPTSSTGSFAITKAPTTLTVSATPSGATTALTARLTDGASPLAGRPVTLTFGGVSCTAPAVTDATGTAGCTVATPSGTSATAAASFAGDPNYLASSATTVVQLAAPTHLTYTGATAAEYGDPATLRATLVDSTGGALPNQQVTFTLGTQTCTATTDARGVARCRLWPLTQKAGAYTLTVSYAGDGASLQASTAAATFTVLHEGTNILVFTHGTILASGSVTLSGVLLEDGLLPLAGKTLTLTLGPKSCTAVTNFLGLASCSVDATGLNGPVTTTATFGGDGYYAASTATGFALLYCYAPGGGVFVVGDRSDHGSVTHWGAQWWKANSLSGGSAPSSFKGYAKNVGDVAYGKSWSTDPGNSSPPPSGKLPAYMAVIVSSSVTRSGSQVSGNIAHVVIVKTDGDYDASPGHAGTATVVATVF